MTSSSNSRVSLQPPKVEMRLKRVDLQKLNDYDYIARLRQTLELGDYVIDDAKEDLKGYREHLRKFDRDRHRQKFGLDELYSADVGKCWNQDETVVLVLSGSNEDGIAGPLVGESWLSPVAVDITQNLLASKRIIAFEICNELSNPEGTIARLIYQLLDLVPEVVREAKNRKELEKRITGRGEDRLEQLEAALLKVIDLVNQPVFIILDRPDRNEAFNASTYIRAMLNVAKATRGRMKVLIVVQAQNWNFDEDRYDTIPKGLDPKLLQTMLLEQHRIK